MKKQAVIFLSVFLLIATTSFAQFRKVPAGVTEAFKLKYPAATEVSWSDKLSAFQASFVLNNEKLEADFSAKGIWKKTMRKLNLDSLPEAVATSFKASKYSTEWVLKSATETQNEDLIYEYRLLVEKSALQKRFLFFDAGGRLFREIATL